MSYYDPYPLYAVHKPIVLTGPPWSGVVACAAWIANTTGIRFVDLDALVEHRMETSVPSLASQALEGTFRDVQLSVLRNELSKKPFGLFATEDVGYWPSLRGLSPVPFYSLDVKLPPGPQFESYLKLKKDKRRAQFGTRPWLQDAPEELEAFGEWLQTRHNGHRICQDVLVMDSAEPITMSKRVIDHLVRTGTFEEYGP